MPASFLVALLAPTAVQLVVLPPHLVLALFELLTLRTRRFTPSLLSGPLAGFAVGPSGTDVFVPVAVPCLATVLQALLDGASLPLLAALALLRSLTLLLISLLAVLTPSSLLALLTPFVGLLAGLPTLLGPEVSRRISTVPSLGPSTLLARGSVLGSPFGRSLARVRFVLAGIGPSASSRLVGVAFIPVLVGVRILTHEKSPGG